MENQATQNNIENTEIIHESTLYAEPIAHVGSFSITNALFTSWIAVFAIIVIVIAIQKSLKEVPKGIQNFFEIVFEGALSLCDQVTNSRKITEKVSIFLIVGL